MRKIILKGPRITLRPLQLSDAPNYVRWFKDKDVVRYLMAQNTKLTLPAERKYIRDLAKQKDHFNLAIITKDGLHIGGSGTTLFPSDKRADVGIVIGDKRYWGKGYATEAISLVADYVFAKLRYNRMELSASNYNKRAIRAYKKVGFKIEGVKRKANWNKITKRFEDDVLMGLLREEWLRKRK